VEFFQLGHSVPETPTSDHRGSHKNQSKEGNMVSVMRRKKSLSPAVIEKMLCGNPRRF